MFQIVNSLATDKLPKYHARAIINLNLKKTYKVHLI